MEFYSNGGHASVFKVSEELKRHSPKSDLVRIERRLSQSPGEAIRAFYRHKIAELLIPEHIIHVNAGFHEFSLRNGEEHITNYLLSKQAAVPETHAVYSAHMQKTFGGIFPCTCDQCTTHERQYHRSYHKRNAAEISIHLGFEWGMYLPHDDPTDYCTDNHGSIVFFETESIDQKRIRERLGQVHIDQSHIDLISHYLDRYEASKRSGQGYAVAHHTVFHE